MDLRKLNDRCLHDPFSTSFTNEVLENMGGQETYSFIDGFFGYHHIKIAQEDRQKTTFSREWGSYQYTMMPFGLKNANEKDYPNSGSKNGSRVSSGQCDFLVRHIFQCQ